MGSQQTHHCPAHHSSGGGLATAGGEGSADSGLVPERLSFFVVGDIGEPGPAREAVARAMRQQMAEGHDRAFVLATGDNFYSCKGEAQFQEEFRRLQTEMLGRVPLAWYFVLGNHDVKGNGGYLHTCVWHGSVGEAGWEFRCPRSFYSVGEDWIARPRKPSWNAALLDLFVLNTNKRKQVLNFLGLAGGKLDKETATWHEQKQWLQEGLVRSSATWKVVVGHHPIELVPHSFVEHAIPGVRFLTSKFMKGHAASKVRGTGVRDIIVQGNTDMYLCGHQHIMAHIVRKPESRWSWGGPGDGNLDYVVIGSSSKLEQDSEDFEGSDVAVEGESTPAAGLEQPSSTPPDSTTQCRPESIDAPDQHPSNSIEHPGVGSDTDGSQSACGSCHAHPRTRSGKHGSASSQHVAGPVPDQDEVRNAVGSNGGGRDAADMLPGNPTVPSEIAFTTDSAFPTSCWQSQHVQSRKSVCSTFWYSEQIGFAVVDVDRHELRFRWYSVHRDGATLVRECVKRKP